MGFEDPSHGVFVFCKRSIMYMLDDGMLDIMDGYNRPEMNIS